jgi:hypothetical protein
MTLLDEKSVTKLESDYTSGNKSSESEILSVEMNLQPVIALMNK